jgi:N-acetylmuramoyl-L-alanine amidase
MMVLALSLFFAGCSTSGVRNTARSFKTVTIDAGHGGHDSGARARSGWREKDAALDVSLRLEQKLRAARFKTVMTRSGDSFVALDKRAAISNRQRNSIFVSIHFNSSPKRAISGAETYYRSPESREIAQRILQHLDTVPGTNARAMRTANFRVLRLNRYPAVLVECGYMSNASEAARASSPQHREALAQAIANAIIEQKKS